MSETPSGEKKLRALIERASADTHFARSVETNPVQTLESAGIQLSSQEKADITRLADRIFTDTAFAKLMETNPVQALESQGIQLTAAQKAHITKNFPVPAVEGSSAEIPSIRSVVSVYTSIRSAVRSDPPPTPS